MAWFVWSGLRQAHKRSPFDRKVPRRKEDFIRLVVIAICVLCVYLLLHLIASNIDSVTLSQPRRDKINFKERRLPQALIIGARKSGTRALLRFLEINPAIKSAHRELHFFDRDENYKLGLEWYREQMPETSPHEITIEKSPAYFVTREAPERIKAMNASIKLILILRNPVTRLISDFSQTIANRLDESLPSMTHDEYYDEPEYSWSLNATSKPTKIVGNVSKAWRDAAHELRSHILRPDGGIDEQRRIVRIGMYAMHLERWLSVFPRGQFHFVNGERLIDKPHEELQKLESFLGLAQPVITAEHFEFSSKKGFYCMRNDLAKAAIRHKRELTTNNNNTRLVCLGKSKGRRHVAVDRNLLNKLKDFYEPHNEYLESVTGLRFNT